MRNSKSFKLLIETFSQIMALKSVETKSGGETEPCAYNRVMWVPLKAPVTVIFNFWNSLGGSYGS